MPLELYDGDTLIQSINFDRVEVGTKFTKEYTIRNNSIFPVEKIQTITSDEDLKIQYPSQLTSNEMSKVIIEFTPKINRRTPLNDKIQFVGAEIIG